MEQPKRWVRRALVGLSILVCGGCTLMAAGTFVECSSPPPLAPMRDRLPVGVELLESENWCGDDAAGDYFRRSHHCVRALIVSKPGSTAGELVKELGGAYDGPDMSTANADHYLMIVREADAWAGRTDSNSVAVIQARGC